MAKDLLYALTRKIMTPVSGGVREAVNNIQNVTAWSGIRGDKENATKAFLNHYGRIAKNGKFVPARPFITNAVEDTGPGEKRKVVRGPKMAMRRAVTEAIQDSIIGKFAGGGNMIYNKLTKDYYYPTKRLSSTKAFGTHTNANGVMLALAKQMNTNQKTYMVETKENAESTLRKKKKRSTFPLIDYGDMREAVKYGIEYDKDKKNS